MVAMAVANAGCATTSEYSPTLAGKTITRKTQISYNGVARSYRLHIPSGYQPQKAVPLVIVVHGAFSSAKRIEEQTGFSTLADRLGFAVSYPNGIGIFGLLQHWNAGHCCGKAAADDVDDIGFIDEVIDDTKQFLNIDRTRMYMVGFSNGGMLTHYYAAERAATLAAIAPVSGPLGSRVTPDRPEWRVPPPQVPLPVIILHGTSDENVPFNGGARDDDPDGRQYVSAQESAEFWVEQNRCDPLPVKMNQREGAVKVTSWIGCSDGAAVDLYALQDWYHQWPGPYFTDQLDPKYPLHGFDAAKVIWRFFENHKRQAE
jgi:polyhydroxybutyrate depolymerase